MSCEALACWSEALPWVHRSHSPILSLPPPHKNVTYSLPHQVYFFEEQEDSVHVSWGFRSMCFCQALLITRSTVIQQKQCLASSQNQIYCNMKCQMLREKAPYLYVRPSTRHFIIATSGVVKIIISGREGQEGGDIYINLQLIHVVVQQKHIVKQLSSIKNFKEKKILF